MKSFFFIITSFIFLNLPSFSQSQKLPNETQLKIVLKGMNAENKINIKDFSSCDSLNLEGSHANDYKIIGGEITFIKGGSMMNYNYPGNAIPLELKNEILANKSGKLLFEKTRVKQISTGKIFSIADLRVSVTQ